MQPPKGFIEVEQNGKMGLFKYTNGMIIALVYDLILPALQPGQIAIGKKADERYAILSDGREQLLKRVDEIPTYGGLGMKWMLDVNSLNIKHRYNSYEEPEYRENGIVFTPSYFLNLGIVSDRQYNLTQTSEESVFEGVTESKTQLVESEVLRIKSSLW